MRSSLLAILTVLCCCGETAEMRASIQDQQDRDRPDASGATFFVDSDDDGLCDRTETEFGTDPEQRDTDADGIPDLIELGNGFDATDSAQPAADQIAHLLARPGATLDFAVRATVEGKGEGVSGFFEDASSFYADMSSAQDFFRDALAISAEPVDSVRGIEAESARFRSVLGRTRLEFSLRFVYSPVGEPPCARAYPFGYRIESDSGELLFDGVFLLVVSQSAADTDAGDYCLPSDCQ